MSEHNTDEFRRNLLFNLPLQTGSTLVQVVLGEEERIRTADGGEKLTQVANVTFTTTSPRPFRKGRYTYPKRK